MHIHFYKRIVVSLTINSGCREICWAIFFSLFLILSSSIFIPILTISFTGGATVVRGLIRNLDSRILSNPIRDMNGNITSCLEIANEITERFAYDEAIKASEIKYRTLFENMSSGFALHRIVLDDNEKPVDYIFEEINSAFTVHTDLTTEIIGKRVTKVHPGIEKMKPDFIGIYGKVALTGKPAQFETYFAPHNKWFNIKLTHFQNRERMNCFVFYYFVIKCLNWWWRKP